MLHQTEKHFKCKACGKGFVSQMYLKMHMVIHSEKQYQCNICDKHIC